jgi:hypothetical protein
VPETLEELENVDFFGSHDVILSCSSCRCGRRRGSAHRSA